MFQKLKYQITKNYLKKHGIDLTRVLEKTPPAQTGQITQTGGDWFKENWDAYLSRDLTKPYQDMMRGLDETSAHQFIVILNRLLIAKEQGWDNVVFNAFDEELAEFKKIQSHLDAHIVRLKENLYGFGPYLIPLGQFEPGSYYYHHFIHELENQDKVRAGNIIDAGAFIGDSALFLQNYTDHFVYAFEPSPAHIELMRETMRLNQCQKIIPVMNGLGARKETLYMPGTVGLGNTLGSGDTAVEIIPLDDFVAENNLTVSVIKADVEGFEQPLLRGALKTIQTQRPALLISIYHNAADFFEIKPMIEALNLGYRFKIRKAFDNHTCRDTMLICEVR